MRKFSVLASIILFSVGVRSFAVNSSKLQKSDLDFHSHSYCSDGIKTPETLVQIAKDLGLKYFALTDHDTVACLSRAMEAAQKLSIRIIPGIEVSAEDDSIHILGLGIDPNHPALTQLLKESSTQRIIRAHSILSHLAEKNVLIRWKEDILISKLNQERKADGLSPADPSLSKESDEVVLAQLHGQITRPDIAKALISKGYARDEKDSFNKYLSNEALGKAGVYQGPSFLQVIETIHEAGGIAVLAHPHTIYKFKTFPLSYSGKSYFDFESVVNALLDAGLDGIEAYRPGWQRYEDEKKIRRIVEAYFQKTGRKISLTVGSDYHGYDDHGPGARTLGNFPTPLSVLSELWGLADQLTKLHPLPF